MKPIANHPGYFVDKAGHVYSNKSGALKEITSRVGVDGYPFVMLYTNGKRTWVRSHRLVASAYICNPDNLPCVCHKDDNKLNTHATNLFWGTHKDNTQDMMKKGRNGFNVGMGVGNSVLTDEQVLAIRSRYQPRVVPARQLAAEYGVHVRTIEDILTRKTWTHLT